MKLFRNLFKQKKPVILVRKYYQFNLNESIRVRLNDKGYQRLADLHNQYIGTFKQWPYRDAEYFKSRADNEGYTTFQAWVFIEKFGEVTSIGMGQGYSPNILIEAKNLT